MLLAPRRHHFPLGFRREGVFRRDLLEPRQCDIMENFGRVGSLLFGSSPPYGVAHDLRVALVDGELPKS